MTFDLDRLRVGPGRTVRAPTTVSRLRPTQGERYLSGPIPWKWITSAGEIRGRALQVGLVVWLLSKLQRSNVVRVNLTTTAREFGVNRSTMSRGLVGLERAGLVEVERGDGRCPVVRLLTPIHSIRTPARGC